MRDGFNDGAKDGLDVPETTHTVNVTVFSLPVLSSVVTVTVVLPRPNELPLSGEAVTDGAASQSSVAVRVKFTMVVVVSRSSVVA